MFLAFELSEVSQKEEAKPTAAARDEWWVSAELELVTEVVIAVSVSYTFWGNNLMSAGV